MAEPRFDVVGIGNAIVDVLAHASDDFLAAQGLAKGTMTLIDAARADRLYAAMGAGLECSGGAAANTMAGIASLGGRAAFIGKVKDDQLGQIFRHDIRAVGVSFESAAAADGPPTARCLILVTADAQRTMSTYLGACVELTEADIDAALLAQARVTYLEGYLWDPPAAKQAFLKAMRAAHEAGGRVALTLSDTFCVERYRAEFLDLVDNQVDLLFANENEIKALYQAADFDAAVRAVRGRCEVAILTRSEKGSLILAGEASHTVAAAPVAKVVDSTGAGDLYAAGFLYGYTQGRDLGVCGRIGALAAAEVIGHLGARPAVSLAGLAARVPA
jgi:sugar/nucleoside kinase (ribokinase family)